MFIKILSIQTEFPLALCLVGKKIEEKVEKIKKAKQTNNSGSVKAKVLSSIKRSLVLSPKKIKKKKKILRFLGNQTVKRDGES